MTKRNGLAVVPRTVLVPPSPFRTGDPPTQDAELIVHDFGPNEPEAARAIAELCEQPARTMLRIKVTPPFRMKLPGPHYDRDHFLVQALKKTGCRFSIVTYPWVCPDEENPKHFCSKGCSVMGLREVDTP